ncbi:Pheromone-regulated membrane protein 10 OS=Candida glabrata (strain ATCC 2001 / CBS 138 / JCM 3761 / NBRC 0622 / NRRL Y-65) GN=CAGL0G04433g PE=3 SV=1 [Rhizoctonia solani AG-1 IB]|uniref:Pheromone-regulated membrane protein 10 n=1 Tax=Thanatephorus cucumeris (strain AG1-IB / isolate 7/3/14) TaxID=1108050 RepID=A0A0B7FNS9_THACB|nr:Pheromone-regulated membrane protein 10 OS=Candida glabrata (strain ATCC 2001 / CBS 138 / JCM 3761 / NBRC 0622 / NRRL Y-65) GN=CAGL0G04433g PE=3 SV=1 [Rhizoctonia solani AG-1 IB]
MSQHPLARRDTRVRFSIDDGNPRAGYNAPEEMEYYQDSTLPVNVPEPVHSPRTRDPGTHSRRSTWSQPESFTLPQGYNLNPHFDSQWFRSGRDSDSIQPVRPMPPGSRISLGETDDEVPSGRLASEHSSYLPQKSSIVRQPGGSNPWSAGDPYRDGRNDVGSVPVNDPSVSSGARLPSNYPALPQNTLRSAMRRSYSENFSAPGVTRAGSSSTLEAGAQVARGQQGLFSNLMQSYGFSRRTSEGSVSTAIDSRYQSRVVSRAGSNESAGALLRLRRMRRRDSALSMGGETLLDDDDPRVTGVKPNRIDDEDKARENFKESLKLGDPTIVLNVNTIPDRQKFILRLAKALMTYGAPSHRIESQLIAAARVLEVDASFVHLPSIIIAAFGDPASNQSETHFVKSGGGLDLGKLHKTHAIYRKVVHDEIGAKDGTLELTKLMRQKPIYGLRIRCVLALLCSAIICPIGFGGSFIDMWIAGCAGATLCWLQLYAASKSALYSNVFEISAAMMVSFVARGLSSVPSGIFCYSAISSAGVVLILPGYMVLCSSLELASKNLISGSVKMVYAIVYSLFLGFSLTIGSDLYFLVDKSARYRREEATAIMASQVTIHGQFKSDDISIFPFNGTFIFRNATADIPSNSHYQAKGCYRDPNWPWYLQEFPGWTLLILVPLFSLFGSFASMQPLKSMQLPVMVFISCAAFAANKAANRYIFNRSDVVSAIGAFVVGVLGNLYSRVFRGTAFVVMVNGIGFLIPSGIAAAGGLAQNYRGSEGDQYSSGLSLGFRMVQVAIGVTVGLFGSGLIVYSFGSRKRGALFAF